MSRKLSTTSRSGAPTKTARAHERDFFGPPPLIPGEERIAYETLWQRVAAAVIPRDVLEEIWVRDVVDLVWDTLRLRRLKANLLLAAAHEGVQGTIKPLVGPFDGDELSNNWARRDPGALKEVGGLLSSAGLTIDAVMAFTLCRSLDKIEGIDRLLASAEARRNNALREVDRHRVALGAALRVAVEDVEDAEFTDVETGQTRARQ